ncbi:hypothetical protein A2480_02260 [Candidatus Uhrbacteria bacterium RIFOXYC2_FULL_47_19]|uniref:DUF11 domain-containing protein n=1 Tax=Candidatus Uhrbacteria bacterium RIFOXYC2_FULL_47_19 TaxID=1802424 RepID=A0A1F7WG49_9BACT|nr:MAG: hypothetical protein A2480_02260 [Candidatus Uhrbacteria bacterium RIFOXYC2_FULL_47_19]
MPKKKEEKDPKSKTAGKFEKSRRSKSTKASKKPSKKSTVNPPTKPTPPVSESELLVISPQESVTKAVPTTPVAPTTPTADLSKILPPEVAEKMPIIDGDEIEKELTEIYFDRDSDQEGDEDMSHFEKVRHSTPKKILIGLLIFTAVLAAASWIGFLFFGSSKSGFTGDQVTMSIEGPTEVKSGAETEFVIRYKNSSDTPLGTATLELRLPDGFFLTSSDPELEDGHTYMIGSLPPWGRGQLTFTGSFLSPLDTEHDIQTIFTYRPANFSSEFQKITTEGILISGSVIEIEAIGPEKSLPGDQVELTFNYRNDSNRQIENIAIVASYPPEFIPESSEPTASDDSYSIWHLGTVEPYGTGSVKVTGAFASEAHGNVTATTKIGYTDATENFVAQAEASATVEVLQGELVAAMVLNGRSNDQAVRLGDQLRYSISYRNTGKASLGNIKVSVQLNSSPETGLILWNELEDESNGQLNDGRITWTSKQIPSLARIEADEEGVIEFSVPLSAEPPTETGNWSLTGWIETEVKSVDGDVVNKTTKSQPILAKVLSDTTISAAAWFYDEEGVPVGSGLLPPEVDQPTTYRAVWTITNSFHDLTDLKLSAHLPDNVSWTGSSQVSAGEISYDSAERNIVWQLNWLPKTVDQVEISFDVTIVPTASQRDRIPTLVDATTLDATDKDINEDFSLSQPPLTTSLTEDTYGAGKGRVK